MTSKANKPLNKGADRGLILRCDRHRHYDSLNQVKLVLVASYMGNLAVILQYPVAHVSYLRRFYLKVKYQLY